MTDNKDPSKLLLELMIGDTQYFIKPKGKDHWEITKFTDKKQPDRSYNVRRQPSGRFWTDSPGFNKAGQNEINIRLIKQHLDDDEPTNRVYTVNKENDIEWRTW